jgi:phytoene dehydrogenase-like protein
LRRAQIGTPRTHRRYLGRPEGTYGPIPSRRPLGIVGMPFNRTTVKVRARLTSAGLGHCHQLSVPRTPCEV